jgi:RNA-directed DNA polymerase
VRVADVANETEAPTDWQAVDWQLANRRVRNLRCRIFRASQQGDHRKVRSLQRLMLRSYSNTLVSVRRVTQENAGKQTAGVDDVVVITPQGRAMLADKLQRHTQPWKAQPARRTYIPKANGKLRPLGIPTVFDRAMQARVKNALEPEWEARFEATSYGFRPGRSAHDAIQQLQALGRATASKRWIVDADIEGAFDNIDHAFLLNTIAGFPARELVKQWLKAGFLDGGVFHETPAGTPQGGVISPLLANIVLHGMEAALGVWRRDGRIRSDRAVVRYADDYVVFCKTREDAEVVLVELAAWLAERGLRPSPAKTRIVHLTQGFDFLGYNVRLYRHPTTRRGYRLLIKPSKESIRKLRERLRCEWLALRGQSAHVVISRLNPIIRGWANYFRNAVSKRVFNSLDNWMWRRCIRYARHTHPRKGWAWLVRRYFGRFNRGRNDRWVFGDKNTGKYLLKFAWTPIRRHVQVRGTSSPDDPQLRRYWEARRAQTSVFFGIDQALARRQRYLCPVCHDSLFNGEKLHRHHVVHRKDGGGDELSNRRLLHRFCHQQIHSGRAPLAAVRRLKDDAVGVCLSPVHREAHAGF